jgi:hypothetical protein
MSPPPIDYQSPEPANRSAARRVYRWVLIGFLAIPVVAAGVGITSLAFMGLDQEVQKVRVERHIPLIEAKIAGDPRFKDVHFGFATVRNGSLIAVGRVENAADLAALDQIVRFTNPRVRVILPSRTVNILPVVTQPASQPATQL